MIAGGGVLVAYAVYTAEVPHPQSLQWWAITMLVFIGIAVVVQLFVQIIFRIVLSAAFAAQAGGDSPGVERMVATAMAEDEMDRIIDLKSMRVGYVILGTGVLSALVTLALAGSPVLGLNILFWSLAAAAIASGVGRVYGFERGTRA